MESNKWEFPCKKCIVSSCCNIYCYKIFDYANMIADNIYKMTDEQLDIYRKTTPRLVKRKIMDLYMHSKKLAFPENATIPRSWD
jgi:hypothetical protein